MYTTGRVWLTTKRKLPSCAVATTITLAHVAEGTIVMMLSVSSVKAHSGSGLEYVTRASVLIVRWLPSSKSTRTRSALDVGTSIGARRASLSRGVSRA